MQPPRFMIPFAQGALEKVESVVVMNAQSDHALDQLGNMLTIEQDDCDLVDALRARKLDVVHRIDHDKSAQSFDRAMVFLGKHGDLNKAMIARAWCLVKQGGDMLIEGAKTDGVDSMIRALKALGLRPNIEPKSHGKILWFARDERVVGAISAWLKHDKPYQNSAGYFVRAGVFSPNQVDKGTEFLLENLPSLKGKVADFGGGYGVITKAILERNPTIESVDTYEVSAMACECAQQNISDPRAHIHWLSVEKAADAYFDAIISNPPFHKGRDGDPAIGKAFIDRAAKSLRAKGDFIMVANRHLPYEHHIRSRFANVDTIAENNAFKIFKATRPNSKGY